VRLPKDTHDLLRIAQQAAQVGAWTVDLSDLSITWSPETYAIHEIDQAWRPTFEAALGFYPADAREQLERAFRNCSRTGDAFDLILPLISAGGRSLWVRVIGKRVFSPSEDAHKVQGAIQDVTALVAAKAEAQQLAQRLETVLESIGDAFVALDLNWRFTFLNAEAEALLQRSRSELIGRDAWEAFPTATAFRTHYEHALEQQCTVRFTEYFGPLGKWFQVSAYPSSEGLSVYFRDVSEERAREEDRKLSQQRFEIVARTTSDVVYDWDLANNRLWWNDGMQTVMGYAQGQLPAGLESWTARIHADDHDRVLQSIDEAIAGGAEEWSAEYRFLRADDSVATVLDRGVIIRAEGGEPTRMVGSMIDVTETRRLEGELRQAQRLEAIGQLTGGVAHDFNNLLTVILSNAELLEDALHDRPTLLRIAQLSRHAAERGGELTSRLLAFSRRQPLTPEPIDVGDLITSMAPLLRRALGDEIQIVLRADPAAPAALADAAQLENAILNLCINARDAMPEGGAIGIDMGSVGVDAQVSDLDRGAYVWLCVADTGAGMDAATLARAFEPFFTTKAAGKGSGLGLSMVYGFAKQSKGKVEITSSLGRGTSVKLWLPSADKACSAPSRRTAANDGAHIESGSERILLVEDNDLVRAHVASMLEQLGYEVTSAADGHEALRKLEACASFDLIFTDMFMPHGVSGVEVALEARKRFPSIKILLASGDPENASLRKERLGPDMPLLLKPYRRATLAAALRSLLARTDA